MSAHLTRGDLDGLPRRRLQAGRGTSAEVSVVTGPDGPLVVKEVAPGAGAAVRRFARWSLAREAAAYERLRGVSAVPKLIGVLDEDAIVLEYRPGTLLSRALAGTLPEAFMGELEAAVEAMHAAGVVHLDLRHRSNVLAGEDGHPVLLDFASALTFDVCGHRGRVCRTLFAWVDRRAVEKWRVRLVQPSSASGSSAGSRGASRAM